MQLRISKLHIACCSLPIANCLLHIVYCQLPIVSMASMPQQPINQNENQNGTQATAAPFIGSKTCNQCPKPVSHDKRIIIEVKKHHPTISYYKISGRKIINNYN